MTINPAWFAAGGVCAAGAMFAWGAVAPGSQLFGGTLRRLEDASCMAITFDDGPNPTVTPRVLKLLERHNAKATFFLIGRHVRAFPALAREIAERGHAIGNHTETHPSLTFLSPRESRNNSNVVTKRSFPRHGKRRRVGCDRLTVIAARGLTESCGGAAVREWRCGTWRRAIGERIRRSP